jgi:hypothetical protein
MRYLQIGVLAILVAAFAAAGLGKLIDAATFHEQFARFGLPEGFVYLTGAIELSGAALLASFNAALRRLGAGMLAVTTAAAATLHLLHDPAALALPALILMALAAWTALVPLRKGFARQPAHA